MSLWTVAAGLLCQWDSPGLVGSLSLRPRGWLDGTESACTAGDPRSIPGSGRSPGEGISSSFWDIDLGSVNIFDTFRFCGLRAKGGCYVGHSVTI